MNHSLLIRLLWLIGLLITAPELVANPIAEGEPLVLNVQQGRAALIDGMLAFRARDGRVFLPLGELSQGIGFAISVDAREGRATGYYLNKGNTFTLDLAEGTLSSAGKTLGFTADQVVADNMDIYVELDSLNQWFSHVTFDFNENYMYIEVVSNPPLPIVQRNFRSRQKAALVASQGEPAGASGLPQAIVDYRLARPPMIDLSSHIARTSSGEEEVDIYMRGVQDLAYMGALWYLALNNRGQDPDARLTLSRKDPDGELLGPLHLTELVLGDIGQRGVPLVTRGLTGRGVRMSNRRRDLFTGSTTELRGELLPGWDVELYRNDVLIGYSSEGIKGEYLFSDVVLQAGLNDLMLVMYGPQGQREERHEIIRIGANQPVEGQWYMEWVALQQEQGALDGVLIGNDAGSTVDQGALSNQVRWTYGLAPGASLALSGLSLGDEGDVKHYAAIATNFSWLGTGVTLNMAQDEQQHRAFAGQWIGEVGSTGALLHLQRFDRLFSSPVSRDGGDLHDTQDLRLSQRFGLGTSDGRTWPLNTYLNVKRKRYWDEAETVDAALGAAANAFGSHITHTLTGNYLRNQGDWVTNDLDGRLNLSTHVYSAQLRTGFRYTLRPACKLREIGLSANLPLFKRNYRLGLDLSHGMGEGDFLSAGLNWRRPYADYSARVSYDSVSGESRISLNVRSALDWSSGGLLPLVRKGSITSQGVVNARVFVDHDGNGVASEGDEPMPGVRISPARADELTDTDGNVSITGISELVPTDVTLLENSLPDPFLRPRVSGYNVMVRPGASLNIDFPLTWVSDIEGKVTVTEPYVNQHGEPVGTGTRGLGNARVQVLSSDGELVKQTRSEYDGFFAITNLPSGRYRVGLEPAQAEHFELSEIEPLEIVIKDDTAVLNGLELKLSSPRLHQVVQRDPESR